jgi:ATP-dependent Clp protease ATP-binding subunit ClpC
MTSGHEHERPSLINHFTQEARDALLLAKNEAKIHKHGYIGTEHILLALVRDPSTKAAQLLAKKANVEKIRKSIDYIIGIGEVTDPNVNIEFAQKTEEVIALAAKECVNNVNPEIDTQHLLFGILEQGNRDDAIGVLESFGITKADLPELRKEAR